MGSVMSVFALSIGGGIFAGKFRMVFFHIYLNEKRLLFNQKICERCIKAQEELMEFIFKNQNEEKDFFGFAIKIIRDLIPDDAILLNEENVKKDFEKDLLSQTSVSFPDFVFFSKNLYDIEKINLNSISFKFSDNKILEKNEKFILMEYTQKIENEYFSIIALGNKEKNIKFVNGFLNFLFDIKEEDNIRLKIERKENDNLIEIIFISSNEGNFKITCINIETESFKNEDIKQLIQFSKTEKNINLIILNQNEFLIDPKDGFQNLFRFGNEKYIFFASPNLFLSTLLPFVSSFLNQEFQTKNKNDSFFNIDNYYLSYYFDYDCIFTKRKNIEINRLYQITMKSYWNLLKIVKEKKIINLNYSLIEDIYIIINNFIEKNKDEMTLYHKYKIDLDKLIKPIEENDSEIYKIKNSINNIEKKIDNEKMNISDQIKYINDQIEIINYFKKDIEINNSFHFPINFDRNKIENEYGKETNVCQVCKYNCHLNCDEYIKKFCKCFKFQFSGIQCQICPNRCYSSSHEAVKYHYPNYTYKTIDDIIKQYINDEYLYVLPHLKVKFVIDKKEKEIKELTKQLEENIKLNSEKINKEEERLKLFEDDRKNLIKQKEEIYDLFKKSKEIIEKERKEQTKKVNEKMEKMPSFFELLISLIIQNYYFEELIKSIMGN